MNKIINLRGTSGAGKSHLIRAIMACCSDKLPVHIDGRKQPLYYTMRLPSGDVLSVIGHYESPCGGCDTISSGTDGIFQLVRDQAQVGHVLFEGLLIGVEVTRTAKLPEVGEAHAVFLSTPIDQCVAGINARRQARGDERPLDPKNTISKHKGVENTRKRMLREAPGVVVHQLDREAALAKVKELLNINQ